LASTLAGNIKKNTITAKIRKYNSAIEASLSENNVEIVVYDNLLKCIHDNLDALYKYISIRKSAMMLDEIHMYDLYTPIVKDVYPNIDYETGKNMVLEGLAPLGEDYISIVKKDF
jgi:oligopeptidase F. Metallo peptidase. MEROPS family M03B